MARYRHQVTRYRHRDLQAPVAKQYKILLFVGDQTLGEGRRTAGPAIWALPGHGKEAIGNGDTPVGEGVWQVMKITGAKTERNGTTITVSAMVTVAENSSLSSTAKTTGLTSAEWVFGYLLTGYRRLEELEGCLRGPETQRSTLQKPSSPRTCSAKTA